ncbi:helix-turn-helix domain-containing protein [uncultured Endozoicomonas sp.]|uniref:helix-turn-helix domain-containing protein n=1 Tax=uncultured Endozoicomonas sp. TaxID=432652 RepID=UPI0026173769|nr:helix-turn-helix domain-containing protein [uncultured Endozoicomonas sp.]
MYSVEDIISRMKEAARCESDIDLAIYLGLSRSNAISSWKSRGSKPYAYCENISNREGVTIDWLLTGREPRFINQASAVVDQKERKLLEMLDALSDENRREILSRIEGMYSASQQTQRIAELEKQLADLNKKIS